ncbi:hypothetical protein AVEN_176403-1 [Araneus ventricosus]|uniref:Uncharacterized protein n=1 Tax=Araneus ventricosus TaxID=182803 RepID=A0A4Y2C6W9_ARAVE|nr:hypothetical protein AVEN_176403-1 [Araneus ventricosus]
MVVLASLSGTGTFNMFIRSPSRTCVPIFKTIRFSAFSFPFWEFVYLTRWRGVRVTHNAGRLAYNPPSSSIVSIVNPDTRLPVASKREDLGCSGAAIVCLLAVSCKYQLSEAFVSPSPPRLYLLESDSVLINAVHRIMNARI